jgi:Tfp pilus assembly protein PilZ
LEYLVSFLTLHSTRIAGRIAQLIVAVQTLLWRPAFAATQIAQNGLGEGFSLQARGGGSGSGIAASGALPWIIGVVCIALIAVLVVTLWPNDSEGNPYQRQRKFARVDNLFLKISAVILPEEDSRRFISNLRATGTYEVPAPIAFENLTMMSVSFGGCSLASTPALSKGNVILLHLNSLPDFPSKDLTVAAKVVWVRSRADSGEPYDTCGAKFLFPSDHSSVELLRQYINFLMDEPLS